MCFAECGVVLSLISDNRSVSGSRVPARVSEICRRTVACEITASICADNEQASDLAAAAAAAAAADTHTSLVHCSRTDRFTNMHA